jgi:soluble lytic murein transglycosylase-like protein
MEPGGAPAIAPQSCRCFPRQAGNPKNPELPMFRKLCLGATLVACAGAALVVTAQARQRAPLDANGNLASLIARHAAENNVPTDLVFRVIKRESGGNPRVVYKGNYGLMQIKLGTARALGYRGNAAGLLDAETNMTYAVKYLAGAYRAAGGNADRAVHYYAAGYYYAAKRKGLRADANGDGLNAYAYYAYDAAPTGTNAAKAAQRLREAKAVNPDASSASDLYNGRIDIPR